MAIFLHGSLNLNPESEKSESKIFGMEIVNKL